MKKFLIWLLKSLYPDVCVFQKTIKKSIFISDKGERWQCFCRKKGGE